MQTAAPSYTILDGSVRQLDRRARIDFMADSATFLAVVTVVAIVAALIAKAPTAAAFAAFVGLVLSGISVLMAGLRWSRFTWQAGPESLDLHHGVITRRSSSVPYHRIQQIDLRQRPVQRMLGLSTLILRTAAASTDAELPGVATADADALRQEFLHRAGLDDLDDAV